MQVPDELTYVGHATTLLRLKGAAVLTDPFLRSRLGPLTRHGAPPSELPQPTVVLISHLHRDHLDLGSLRRIPAATPRLVPRGAGSLVSKAGDGEVLEMRPGETASFGRLSVTAVRAEHDGHRDRWGSHVQPLGYLIACGRYRAYFAGDTDLFDGMAELAPLDLALLPVWGWGPTLGPGHLDPRSAAQALVLLRPRVAVPIHWGTLYPAGLGRFLPGPLFEPPLEFARFAAGLAPDVDVRVLHPGARLGLSASTLEGVS